MVEMTIDGSTKIQIYSVGNILTAVIVDSFGNVMSNREFTSIEVLNLIKN